VGDAGDDGVGGQELHGGEGYASGAKGWLFLCFGGRARSKVTRLEAF
jgi:hypothetical protein